MSSGQNQAPPSLYRCKCGQSMPTAVYVRTGLYAVTIFDVELDQQHKQTTHDVLTGTGRRVRIGACKAKGTGIEQR